MSQEQQPLPSPPEKPPYTRLDLNLSETRLPHVHELEHGPAVFGTFTTKDKSRSVTRPPGWPLGKNQDRFVINNMGPELFAAVADGAHGRKQDDYGDVSAHVAAGTFQENFRQGRFAEIHAEANLNLKKANPKGAAAYAAIRISGDRLDVLYAGDVRVLVIGRDGSIRFISDEESLDGKLHNGLSGSQDTTAKPFSMQLQEGDTILIASDGLWSLFDNIKDQNAEDVVRDYILPALQAGDVVRAYKILMQLVEKADRPDDTTIFLHQIQRLPQ